MCVYIYIYILVDVYVVCLVRIYVLQYKNRISAMFVTSYVYMFAAVCIFLVGRCVHVCACVCVSACVFVYVCVYNICTYT
jgi:hypothetical protein